MKTIIIIAMASTMIAPVLLTSCVVAEPVTAGTESTTTTTRTTTDPYTGTTTHKETTVTNY